MLNVISGKVISPRLTAFCVLALGVTFPTGSTALVTGGDALDFSGTVSMATGASNSNRARDKYITVTFIFTVKA